MIPVGIICRSRFLNELSNAENLDSIIEILEECKLGDYAYILKKHEKLLNEGLKSRLPVEARLDDEYHRNMQALTENLKDGFVLSKVVSLLIDLTNLQIICRAIIDDIGAEVTEYIITSRSMIPNKAIKGLLSLKLSDIPNRLENTQYRDIAEEISSSYDRAKSITVVEEIIDKHKFRLVKETLSPRMLSPVIIAWYLILKEIELRNLRLISKALIDNIPREEIEDFLVL
jgi:vacuolar-type H+-ATPase subunit C/Vma6